jgi:2-isopropylmalate synthase
MGKHSGRNALSTRLQQLGFDLSTQEVDDVFKRFKALADKKKGITDDDILALVGDEVHQPAEIWKLVDLQVGSREEWRKWVHKREISSF